MTNSQRDSYFLADDQSLNGGEALFRSGHVFLVRSLWTAGGTGLAGWLFLYHDDIVIIGDADCGRKEGSVETAIFILRALVAIFVTVATIIVIAASRVAIIPVVPLTVAAIFTGLTFGTLLTLRTAIIFVLTAGFSGDFSLFAFFAHIALIIAPVAAFAFFVAPFALRAAFFLTAAIIGEHTEIMVGELQIIFRVHPVAIMLCVLRQLFEFFEHLARVAARPVVDPILVIITVAIIILRTVIVIAPTAPAVGLAIIHKDISVLKI